MSKRKFEVGGTAFSCMHMDDAVDSVIQAGKDDSHCTQFVFANAYSVIISQSNPDFRAVCRRAEYIFPDGFSIVSSVRLLYKTYAERLAGPDVLDVLLGRIAQEGLKVFLFGSTPKCLDLMIHRMRQEYPTLQVVGVNSPPFGAAWTEQYDAAVIKQIQESKASIILVGVSTPKQDIWIDKYKQHLSGAALGIGAAFDFYAGLIPRAPMWVRRLGMEWLLRLLSEPRRLWRRYLLGNAYFVMLVIRQMCKRF